MLVAVTVSTICGVGVPVFAADMADVSSSLSDMELLSELSEPVSVEPDASIVNAETYLSQHVDVRYAKFSQLEPVDILYVKQTFADGNLLSKEVRTIDSLWQENGVYEDAFLMQNQGYAVLYDADASSDYYVAYANPMVSDTAFVLSDVVFAYADLDGNVLADCIYTEDGLAYVPKKYTKENRNGLTATVFTLPATDKNGKTLLGNLPLGTYLLEETTVPKGYLKADDQRVTIN